MNSAHAVDWNGSGDEMGGCIVPLAFLLAALLILIAVYLS